jgi:hypothetical protein
MAIGMVEMGKGEGFPQEINTQLEWKEIK